MIDLGADGRRSDREDHFGTWLRYAEDEDEDGRSALGSEWLLPFLLLSIRERDLHGNELLQKVEGLGFETAPSGEVYRMLWKAESEGLVFSEPGEVAHVLPRWRYGLTEVGEAYLEFLANSLAAYSKEIEAFLRVYDGRALRGAQG